MRSSGVLIIGVQGSHNFGKSPRSSLERLTGLA